VDSDEDKISAALYSNWVEVRQMGWSNLGFDDESFELVSIINVLLRQKRAENCLHEDGFFDKKNANEDNVQAK